MFASTLDFPQIAKLLFLSWRLPIFWKVIVNIVERIFDNFWTLTFVIGKLLKIFHITSPISGNFASKLLSFNSLSMCICRFTILSSPKKLASGGS